MARIHTGFDGTKYCFFEKEETEVDLPSFRVWGSEVRSTSSWSYGPSYNTQISIEHKATKKIFTFGSTYSFGRDNPYDLGGMAPDLYKTLLEEGRQYLQNKAKAEQKKMAKERKANLQKEANTLGISVAELTAQKKAAREALRDKKRLSKKTLDAKKQVNYMVTILPALNELREAVEKKISDLHELGAGNFKFSPNVQYLRHDLRKAIRSMNSYIRYVPPVEPKETSKAKKTVNSGEK